MECKVRLKPSNASFTADLNKTILEAALGENIHLEHSCKNGDCDTCSAVLLSGKVMLESGDVIESGAFLTCNSRPLGAIEMEANYYPELAAISRQMVPLKVNSVKKVGDGILQLLFRFSPTANFEYLAGQYIDLTYQGVTRSYSIANVSNKTHELELHIKQVENGAMSTLLFDALETNTLMRAFGPNGTFFVRESESPIAFLVTGTGFAPAKAMIESLLYQKGTSRVIYLFWGGRNETDLYSEEPKKWMEECRNFDYIPVLSRAHQSWSGAVGYVQSAFIDMVDDLSGFQVYACGSPAMIDSAKSLLIESGLSKSNFYSDAFVATTN